MRQGRDLEDYVAQRFSEETGFKVRRANAIYQSEEHPLLLADFDRLIVGQKAGLECKTVSPFSADKWADGKIPAHYLAQVDHYLAVSGFDCWYVVALIFGRELVIHKIVTDKQVLSDLIDKEELFWTNHVVPQIPPAPNGCDCDTQQINQMYEVDNRDKTADLSALHGLLDKRQELSDQIEQMEQEKTAIEQQVKLKMQDAAYGHRKSIRKIIRYRLQRSSGSQEVRQHGTEICKLGVCLGRGEEAVSFCQLRSQEIQRPALCL